MATLNTAVKELLGYFDDLYKIQKGISVVRIERLNADVYCCVLEIYDEPPRPESH